MKCPRCQHPRLHSFNNTHPNDKTVRRRRKCPECGFKFSTLETLVELPLMVVKRDGRRQPFSLGKLRESLEKAIGKQPIGKRDKEEILERVDKLVKYNQWKEISSFKIYAIISRRLRELDRIAYNQYRARWMDEEDDLKFTKDLKHAIRGMGGILG